MYIDYNHINICWKVEKKRKLICKITMLEMVLFKFSLIFNIASFQGCYIFLVLDFRLIKLHISLGRYVYKICQSCVSYYCITNFEKKETHPKGKHKVKRIEEEMLKTSLTLCFYYEQYQVTTHMELCVTNFFIVFAKKLIWS